MTQTGGSPIEDQIRRAEARRFEAMTARDLSVLDELLDDRLRYTHSSGVRDSKVQYLAAVRDDVYVYGPVDHVETEITVLGDVAIVTGEMYAEIKVKGAPKTLNNASTAVWTQKEEMWRLVSYQTTPLPQA